MHHAAISGRVQNATQCEQKKVEKREKIRTTMLVFSARYHAPSGPTFEQPLNDILVIVVPCTIKFPFFLRLPFSPPPPPHPYTFV